MFSNDNHVFQVPIIYRTNPMGSQMMKSWHIGEQLREEAFFFFLKKKKLFFIFNKEKYV